MRAHRRDDEWLRPCLMEDVKSGAGDGREIGDAPAADADGDAVIPADSQSPARYRGLGENPNTLALLFALGLPRTG